MKKFLFLCVLGCVFQVQAGSEVSGHRSLRLKVDSWRQSWDDLALIPQDYADFKKSLLKKLGLSYTLDASILPQRFSPGGQKTAWQTQYYGTMNWNMFSSETFGSGSVQLAYTMYTMVRYWGDSASNLAQRLGIANPINDYDLNSNYFDQLSYSHTFSGSANILSVTVGQFPMYLFDGGDYDSNQQINFLNEALSQNATSNYPSASLGAYATLTPNSKFNLTIGAQNANNISGETISWNKLKKGKFTEFISATWTPTFMDLLGQYSFLFYYQPSAEAQATTSRGWSFNLQQNITKNIALFARINGVGQSAEFAKQSYVFGGVWNNPFQHNALDQVGLAMAFNKIDPDVQGASSRSWENVLEGYYSFGISNFLILTPDIQLYINPANNLNRHTAVATSLRATLMF